jgi:hypothetical protein
MIEALIILLKQTGMVKNDKVTFTVISVRLKALSNLGYYEKVKKEAVIG